MKTLGLQNIQRKERLDALQWCNEQLSSAIKPTNKGSIISFNATAQFSPSHSQISNNNTTTNYHQNRPIDIPISKHTINELLFNPKLPQTQAYPTNQDIDDDPILHDESRFMQESSIDHQKSYSTVKKVQLNPLDNGEQTYHQFPNNIQSPYMKDSETYQVPQLTEIQNQFNILQIQQKESDNLYDEQLQNQNPSHIIYDNQQYMNSDQEIPIQENLRDQNFLYHNQYFQQYLIETQQQYYPEYPSGTTFGQDNNGFQIPLQNANFIPKIDFENSKSTQKNDQYSQLEFVSQIPEINEIQIINYPKIQGNDEKQNAYLQNSQKSNKKNYQNINEQVDNMKKIKQKPSKDNSNLSKSPSILRSSGKSKGSHSKINISNLKKTPFGYYPEEEDSSVYQVVPSPNKFKSSQSNPINSEILTSSLKQKSSKKQQFTPSSSKHVSQIKQSNIPKKYSQISEFPQNRFEESTKIISPIINNQSETIPINFKPLVPAFTMDRYVVLEIKSARNEGLEQQKKSPITHSAGVQTSLNVEDHLEKSNNSFVEDEEEDSENEKPKIPFDPHLNKNYFKFLQIEDDLLHYNQIPETLNSQSLQKSQNKKLELSQKNPSSNLVGLESMSFQLQDEKQINKISKSINNNDKNVLQLNQSSMMETLSQNREKERNQMNYRDSFVSEQSNCQTIILDYDEPYLEKDEQNGQYVRNDKTSDILSTHLRKPDEPISSANFVHPQKNIKLNEKPQKLN